MEHLVSKETENGIKQVYSDDKVNFLLKGEPVEIITSNQFEKTSENDKLVDRVLDFFYEQGAIIDSKLGQVTLDRKGIQNTKQHGLGEKKVAAFAAIKTVLEKGEIILPLGVYREEQQYINQRIAKRSAHIRQKHNQTAAIAAPIMICDEKYICVVILMMQPQPHIDLDSHITRLYVHETYLLKNFQDFVASSSVYNNNEFVVPQNLRSYTAKLLIAFLTAKERILNNPNLTNSNEKSEDIQRHSNKDKHENSNYNNNIKMRNNNQALYESIMKDVAKVIKNRLNENENI